MEYDFSRVERRGTDCLKFDFAPERGKRKDCLSYWVADMDFKTAPEVLDELHKRVDHGIFGYTNIKRPYFDAVAKWQSEHFGYEVRREWMVETPGVVFALYTAVHAFTKPGEAVLVQPPVYYPFLHSAEQTGRRLVENPLVWRGTRYEVDFDDFEQKIADNGVKLFLLCNPHNPGGTSWTKGELERMADICLRHGVTVASDEIHSDFVWRPQQHTVFASISPEVERITVTCTSPSKSFNLAGLQVSNIFIADRDKRKAFKAARDATGYDEPGVLGLVAAQAAYEKGGAWLDAAKRVIEANLEDAVRYIGDHGGGKVTCQKPQATYLLWLDYRAAGCSDEELNARVDKANVWLDAGNVFGRGGELFLRVNAATTWEYLERGLLRLCALF